MGWTTKQILTVTELAMLEVTGTAQFRIRSWLGMAFEIQSSTDDEPFRTFDTTADYRRWCEQNLPDWLGYGRV